MEGLCANFFLYPIFAGFRAVHDAVGTNADTIIGTDLKSKALRIAICGLKIR